MKPTQEQLNDPQWWSENGGETSYCYLHEPTNAIWFSAKEEKNLTNLEFLAKRPVKPAFVPEVGVECEFDHPNFGWTSCEPIGRFRGKMVCAPNGGGFYQGHEFNYRPIKSERELLIEIIVAQGNLSEGVLADGILNAGFCLKEPTK